MIVHYGAIIVFFAFAFLLYAIDKADIMSALISLLLWVFSAYLSIKTEALSNGTVFIFQDKLFLVLSGVMAVISGVLAGLIYIKYMDDLGRGD